MTKPLISLGDLIQVEVNAYTITMTAIYFVKIVYFLSNS